MTRYEALERAITELRDHVDSPSLDAQVLLCHVGGFDKLALFVHRDLLLSEQEIERFFGLIARRKAHCPVAYLTGTKAFMGLDFHVDERVLIPRPDTEILVETLIETASGDERILDLGTGSGAIAVSLAHYLPDTRVWAGDVSDEALAVAEKNGRTHGGRVTFVKSDLFEAFTGMVFDLIVSNPPYISERDYQDLMSDVRDYEPVLALVAPDQGLAFYSRIICEAGDYLASGGRLAFEIGYDQAQAVGDMMRGAGYERIKIIRDLAGHDRVVIGTMR